MNVTDWWSVLPDLLQQNLESLLELGKIYFILLSFYLFIFFLLLSQAVILGSEKQ